MSYRTLNGMGATCGECQFVAGDTCVPCPDGYDVPECQGCVDGQRQTQKWHETFWGVVATGVVSSVVVAVATTYILGRTRK